MAHHWTSLSAGKAIRRYSMQSKRKSMDLRTPPIELLTWHLMLVQVRENKHNFTSTPGIHTQAQKRLAPHVSKALIIWTGNGRGTVRTRRSLVPGLLLGVSHYVVDYRFTGATRLFRHVNAPLNIIHIHFNKCLTCTRHNKMSGYSP